MSITGEPSGPPVRAGVSFLDLTTGIFSALGICNALLYRAKTGLGQRVDGSLLETAVTMLNYHAEGFLLTGNVPKALGSSHPSLAPYRNFRCRDGQWVFIAGANDRFWQRLVTALDLPSLRDERFATNLGRVRHRDDLEKAVADAIGAYDREPLLKLLEDGGITATPVNTVDQVMNDPQTAARQMIERVLHPKLGEIPVIGAPTKYSRMRPGVRRPAPLQGEHTDEVLAECGYSAEAIGELRTKKVVR
jgi:crotonobetainyl-CoA:carnitine CoA-transferase CaiB-like acyl-CoA transferase